MKNKKEKQDKQKVDISEVLHGIGDGLTATVAIGAKCVGEVVKCVGSCAGKIIEAACEGCCSG